MPFVAPPAYPPFIASMMPFSRSAYELERGGFKGHTIHYLDHGNKEGKVLLMCHGNPTWSFLWRKVIEALDPNEYRCLAPDLVGMGFSTKPKKLSAHTLAHHTEALCEWVEAMELSEFILVGQDWGGPMTTGLGAAFPEKVRGIVLGNTAVVVPEHPKGTTFHRFSRMPLVSDFVFRVLGFPQNNLASVQGDRGSIRGEVARAYRWPLRGFGHRAAPLALARMVPDSATHESIPCLRKGEAWLTSFAGPIALVWGQKDPVLGRAIKRHTRILQDASVTLTDAGHFLQEEVPDEIAEAIREVDAKAGGQ